MQMGVLDKLIMYWDEETMVQSPNFAAVWDEVADKEWYDVVTPDDATSTVWTVFSNHDRLDRWIRRGNYGNTRKSEQ